jgi:LPXTG-site transpeptidase (sortase) family protein
METTFLSEERKRRKAKARSRGMYLVLSTVAFGLVTANIYAYASVDRSKPLVNENPSNTEAPTRLPKARATPSWTFGQFTFTLPTTNSIGGLSVVPDSITATQEVSPIQGPKAEERPLEPQGLPVRIHIPKIGVDAPIKKVALAKDGSMDVPKRPFDTAWYERGPRPGETGSATIAGHVDWSNGAEAVFTDLHELEPGDTISVQNDFREETSFVVRERREFDAKEDAAEVFYSFDGKSYLNLVTCAGEWDEEKRAFAKRLVVFAEKVKE